MMKIKLWHCLEIYKVTSDAGRHWDSVCVCVELRVHVNVCECVSVYVCVNVYMCGKAPSFHEAYYKQKMKAKAEVKACLRPHRAPGQGWRTCGLNTLKAITLYSSANSWGGPAESPVVPSLQKIQTTSVIYGGHKTKMVAAATSPAVAIRSPRKIAQWLRALDAHAEDPSSIPSTHMAAQNCSSRSRGLYRSIDTHIRLQAKYPTHNKK